MTPATPRLFHGGVPGLRPGALIEPGHQRPARDGCPICAARNSGATAYVVDGGEAHAVDGPSQRGDRVYATEHRLYAKFHASMYGRGDLYRVEALGTAEPSAEDPPAFGVWAAPALRVLAAVDRAVQLTWNERRRLWREWPE